ncbi:MAG: hypothetical protein ACR2QM_05910 [Longimicrobiales bacterium]
MSDTGIGDFWTELRRRRVVRAMGVYVAAAFIALQVGEIILPAFNTPDWALQTLVVLAVLGLPIVLAVAWVYDVTPAGVERTGDSKTSGARSMLPPLAFLLVTTVAVGFAALAFARITFLPAGAGAPDGVASFVSLDADAPITAIAVLPLDDFTEGDEIFTRSLHEEIIAQLAGMTSLRVVSRTSVERYVDSDLLLPQIAQELRVQAIVEGSVTRPADSDSVKITIQLIHAPSDTHMMAQTFQRELQDILRLQQEVAQEIVIAIQGEVDGDEPMDLTAIAVVDPEAHQAFLQGQMEFDRETPEGLQSALSYFHQAIELDSTYSQAYAGLAGTRVLMGLNGQAPLSEVLADAHRDAQQAVALGGAGEESQAVLAIIQQQLGELPEELRGEIEIATEDLDQFSRTYVENFTQLGSRARAARQSREAQGLGACPIRSRMFEAQRLVADGEFAAAGAIFEGILEEEPTARPAWDALERTAVLQGDYEEAVDVRKERILATSSDPAGAQERIASLEAEVDPDESSSYWLWLREDHARQERSGEYASDVEYAAACVALGDYEDAIKYLETAVEKRDPALLTLQFDQTWDMLRDDPRFKAITREVRNAVRGRRGGPTPPGRP